MPLTIQQIFNKVFRDQEGSSLATVHGLQALLNAVYVEDAEALAIRVAGIPLAGLADVAIDSPSDGQALRAELATLS